MPWMLKEDQAILQTLVPVEVPYLLTQARIKAGFDSNPAYIRHLIQEGIKRDLGVEVRNLTYRPNAADLSRMKREGK
jgi:hypothetical protein